MHSLMVESLGGVQSACSWVQSELPQTEWICAAQECKGQFVFLIPVYSIDLQDLSPCWLVFWDVYNIDMLGELWPVIVGVNDTDKHLKKKQITSLNSDVIQLLAILHPVHHRGFKRITVISESVIINPVSQFTVNLL